jgi:hypothetical protein
MPTRRRGWWRNRLMRWRARVAGCFARGEVRQRVEDRHITSDRL